jgi:hypothetical protein
MAYLSQMFLDWRNASHFIDGFFIGFPASYSRFQDIHSTSCSIWSFDVFPKYRSLAFLYFLQIEEPMPKSKRSKLIETGVILLH